MLETYLIYGIIACIVILAFPSKKKKGIIDKVQKESAQIKMLQLFKEY